MLGIGTIEQERPPERLHDLCGQGSRERVGDLVAALRAFAPAADLDQLVPQEGLVDRGRDCFGDAVLADLDDRLEMVAERAQEATLLSTEGCFGGGHPIVVARGSGGVKSGPPRSGAPSLPGPG
jgi:hypothetical protein